MEFSGLVLIISRTELELTSIYLKLMRLGHIAGLQEQAPNHLKLRWLRARVVSVKDKSWLKTVAGEVQGDEQPRTTDEVSKH